MPPSTKRQTRKQTRELEIDRWPRLEDDPSSYDRVDDFATMYPAFCTAPIPVEILDELIDETKEGLNDLVEGGLLCGSLCILDTKDLDSVVHGSRKPMQPFESPFIGMTDDQVRSWMKEHEHPHFAYGTFAVLDEDTIKNKTCRIGCTHADRKEADKMQITDFYASMHVRVPIEMATLSWCEQIDGQTGKVYNRKYIEGEERKRHQELVREAQEKGAI